MPSQRAAYCGVRKVGTDLAWHGLSNAAPDAFFVRDLKSHHGCHRQMTTLRAIRSQAAIVRALLDELERVDVRRSPDLNSQMMEELERLGRRILETTGIPNTPESGVRLARRE
jgi:hypothetical protein